MSGPALRPRVALTLDVGTLLTMAVVASVVAMGPLVLRHPQLLTAAIAFDLVVTASAIHYLLGVRLGGLPSWTVSVVAMLGALLTGVVLPGAHAVGGVAALLVAVELAIGGVALVRIRTLWRGARTARAAGAGRLDALEQGLVDALGSKVLAGAVVSELRLIWLGVFGSFRGSPVAGYTCHREVGWMGLAGVLVGLSFLEIPMVHLGLDYLVGGLLAWPVTLLSMYGMAWIWGDAQALRLYPSEIGEDVLELRVGLRWRLSVPLSAIESVEPTEVPAVLDVSLMSPNLRLVLRRPVTAHGLFGIARTGSEVSLRMDSPEVFAQHLRAAAGCTSA